MPEPTPADLRRLERLEGRIGKAQDSAKLAREASRAAQEELRTSRQELKTLTARTERAETQLERLLAENQRLADELAPGPLDEASQAATAARERAEAAEKRAAAADGEAADERRRADGLQASVAQLEERVRGLTAQLKEEKGVDPAIFPDEVAGLLDDLISRLRGGLHGLDVRDGELRLNVAFAKVGDRSAFVVPTVDAKPLQAKSVHELAIRFEQTPEV